MAHKLVLGQAIEPLERAQAGRCQGAVGLEACAACPWLAVACGPGQTWVQ